MYLDQLRYDRPNRTLDPVDLTNDLFVVYTVSVRDEDSVDELPDGVAPHPGLGQGAGEKQIPDSLLGEEANAVLFLKKCHKNISASFKIYFWLKLFLSLP